MTSVFASLARYLATLALICLAITMKADTTTNKTLFEFKTATKSPITEVMGDIGKLLDASITGVDMPAKPAPVMDLSKIDFEALRSRFKESKHQNTDLEVLKAAIRAQLEKLIRLNKNRPRNGRASRCRTQLLHSASSATGRIGFAKTKRFPNCMNPNTPFTRRDFIRAIAATSTSLAFPGCCSLRRPGIPQPIIPPGGLFIDPHCHIFNGRDLDIYNYVAGGVPWYAYVSLPVLYSLTELIRSLAPTHEDELRELNKWLDKSKVWLKSPAAPAELSRANELLAIETTKFVDKLEYEKAVERDRVINAPSPEEAFQRARAKISQAWKTGGIHIDSVEAQERQQRVFEHLPEALEKLKTKPGVLAFFDCFFHYRIVNAARLKRAYPMMSLFTPAMMDTDSWFQHRPLKPMDASTPLAPQIEIYEKIAIVTNARFLPIFAFDPRRQVEWEKNPDALAPPFELVKECLKKNCFVGLKLYPPMGYRPANNAERDATPNKDWWKGLGHSMDAVLRSTFTCSSKSDLPVMAHANRSNGSEKRYNDDSAPEFWRMALKDNPDLKVNLGHFGGLDNKSGWRSGFCDLMADYRGVYADTGDFIELSGGKKREKFVKDLAWRSEHTTAPVVSRLMYGSDFFMNGLTPDYKQYAEEWIYSFQRAFPEEWPKLVGGNAADYLGLREGIQRQRLGVFLSQNGLTPEWEGRVKLT